MLVFRATLSSTSTRASSGALCHPVYSLLGRLFSTPSTAYRRLLSDSLSSSPSAAILSSIRLSSRLLAARWPAKLPSLIAFSSSSRLDPVRSDLGPSDLDSVSRISRQNCRRLTVFAGDNPAGRTRGFNLKLTP